MLNAATAEYFCSSTNSYGFKILLHSPNDSPKIAHYGTSIPNGFESYIAVKPIVVETTNAGQLQYKIYDDSETSNFFTLFQFAIYRFKFDNVFLKVKINCLSTSKISFFE